jgi:hypothetical protein
MGVEENDQTDRLGLKLGLKNIENPEWGNPALDHLSTLIEFHLLSPRVLRSQSLLPSIPPLTKLSRSR